MPPLDDLSIAHDALDECRATLEQLAARCCEPGRSPRMSALGGTLDRASEHIRRLHDDPSSAPAALADLEDAGGQVGALQVGCCAPNRLPLYAEILEGLSTAQLAVTRSLDLGH